MWAMRAADEDGLLLVELQTVSKPLRFSITIADAFSGRPTQRQELHVFGRSRAKARGRAVVQEHGAARASPPFGLPSLTRIMWPQTWPCCLGARRASRTKCGLSRRPRRRLPLVSRL
jgi:hypothetical protein